MTESRQLTLEQLKGFLAIAERLDAGMAELRSELVAKPDKMAAIESRLFSWGKYYDSGPMPHTGRALRYFGLLGPFLDAALHSDSMQELLRLAEEDIPDEWAAREDSTNHILGGFALLESLYQSIRSVGYYGKWVHELISEGRAGEDTSWLKALTVDPCVTGSSYFQERLGRAVVTDDKAFIASMAKALAGPTKKISRQHNRIRVAAKLLLDAGALPMPGTELVRLFCEDLKLYRGGEDPAKALKKIIKVVTPTPTT